MSVTRVDKSSLRNPIVKIPHVIVQHCPALKLTVQPVTCIAQLHLSPCSRLRPADHEQIISAVYLIKVRTLISEPDILLLREQLPRKASRHQSA